MAGNYVSLTRAALLLALTLLFQSLRLFIPIPAFFSTFLIGSLVNACFLTAAEKTGLIPALLIAAIAPVIAYFQQMLPLPPLIFPVALGNMLYIALYFYTARFRRDLAILLAAAGKAGFLFGAFTWLVHLLAIPPKMATALLFVMSWPQVVTGVIGGVLMLLIIKRIQH